jgi:hypothetical protein
VGTFRSILVIDLGLVCVLYAGKSAFLRGMPLPGFLLLLGRVFKSGFSLTFSLGFLELHAGQVWQEEPECLVWSTVIRLYLVRSVTKILAVLDDAPENPLHIELLRLRLTPLRCAQQYLEKVLGLAEGEDMRANAVPELAKQGREHFTTRLGDVEVLIIASREDLVALWTSEDVRAKLATYGMRLNGHSRLLVFHRPSVSLVVLTSSVASWITSIA